MKKYLFSSDLCGIRRRKSLRIKDRLQRGKAAISTPKNDRVQRMVDITAKKAKGKGKGYEKWATLHNLKQMAVTISIYEESGFSSPEELEAALTAASAELSNVHAELKAVESTLREKKDLQKQLLAYIKTKPARDGLKAQKTEKARKNYREQRKIEFIIAEAATRFLMLIYGKEASNRKQEIDRQHHTIPNQRNQRPKDKHCGNVHNRLWNHG